MLQEIGECSTFLGTRRHSHEWNHVCVSRQHQHAAGHRQVQQMPSVHVSIFRAEPCGSVSSTKMLQEWCKVQHMPKHTSAQSEQNPVGQQAASTLQESHGGS